MDIVASEVLRQQLPPSPPTTPKEQPKKTKTGRPEVPTPATGKVIGTVARLEGKENEVQKGVNRQKTSEGKEGVEEKKGLREGGQRGEKEKGKNQVVEKNERTQKDDQERGKWTGGEVEDEEMRGDGKTGKEESKQRRQGSVGRRGITLIDPYAKQEEEMRDKMKAVDMEMQTSGTALGKRDREEISESESIRTACKRWIRSLIFVSVVSALTIAI